MTRTVEQIWRRDFTNACSAIPESWLHREVDGFVGINPEHRDEPAVVLYHKLLCVGYARGWML